MLSPGSDSGAEDAGAIDSGAEDAGAIDSTPRIVPLVGTASGIVTGMPSWTERSTLYLPAGWRAGADAWLDLQPFTFDAAGIGHPTCHLGGCTLTLDPSDGCAHYHYDNAQLMSGDQILVIDGDLVACDDGSSPAAPTAILSASVPGSERIGLRAPLPTSVIAVTSAIPIEASTGTQATLRVDGADAAATVVSTPGQLTLSPSTSLRMGAAVNVALDGVVDVMGRPFAEPVALGALSTTAAIVDATFTAAPPSGAVSANGAATTLSAGVFCLGGGFSGCTEPADHPLGVALALADPGSSTWLTLTLAPDAHSLVPVFAAVARADGTMAASVSIEALSAEVPIPAGTGPVWLLLYATEQRPGPCPSKPSWPSVCLDSLALR